MVRKLPLEYRKLCRYLMDFQLITNPREIFTKFFKPETNQLASYAVKENYDTYEVGMYLSTATDGEEFVMVKGPVWQRIEDMPQLIKESFDKKVVGWCVPLDNQAAVHATILAPDAKASILRWALYKVDQDEECGLIKVAD